MMSVVSPTLEHMDDSYLPAVCMAALELLPAQPSDLAKLLLDPLERQALTSGCSGASELTEWLLQEIESGRVDVWHKRLDRVRHDLQARPILAHEDTYPRALRDCWDAPPLLFVRGSIGNGPRIAIVGSRDAADAALRAARAVARAVAETGVEVVSGLAAGIDTAAHQGALDAGGRTVAVMGTGIQRVFPPENASLVESIAATGGVLSQFAPDAPRTGTTFLHRNNVIAGLADVNLVMGGRERSGSRHQAEQAIRYHRNVLLWAPTLANQAWARKAVHDGAASFVTSIDQVVACLPTAH